MLFLSACPFLFSGSHIQACYQNNWYWYWTGLDRDFQLKFPFSQILFLAMFLNFFPFDINMLELICSTVIKALQHKQRFSNLSGIFRQGNKVSTVSQSNLMRLKTCDLFYSAHSWYQPQPLNSLLSSVGPLLSQLIHKKATHASDKRRLRNLKCLVCNTDKVAISLGLLSFFTTLLLIEHNC